MPASPSVSVERFRGQAAVVLRGGAGPSGELEATFLPSMGMLGASLTFAGEEYLSLHGGVAAFLGHHTTGIPLLHPWANRLDAAGYVADDVEVLLAGRPNLNRDEHGLPIHGTMVGPWAWSVERVRAGVRAATLRASFDFGAHDELLASFPFPHVVEVGVRVRGRSLAVTTTIRPTGKAAVPISFGWHPYFRLPGVPRADITLVLPRRRHLALDDLGLPTGEETREAPDSSPLGDRSLDDGFRLGRRDRTFALRGRGRGLDVDFDDGYPFAQVYAPLGTPFVALEPMTAPTNALATGEVAEVDPSGSFSATFTVRIARPAPAEDDAVTVAST